VIEAPVHVQVGEVYPVSCVYGNHGIVVPVFPTPHHDRNPEFFVNVEEHYHVDNRFISDWNPHTAIRAKGKKPFVQERPCLFVKHEPPPNILWMHLALLQHYENHKLKDCNICPHKGMPIINGVCAGHGMKWNANGYLKHRGPFKMRWMGNTVTIDNLEKVIIPITVAAHGPLILDILDNNDELVFTHHNQPSYDMHAGIGDEIIVNNNEAYLRHEPTS
jgi:hypothetical protein